MDGFGYPFQINFLFFVSNNSIEIIPQVYIHFAKITLFLDIQLYPSKYSNTIVVRFSKKNIKQKQGE